MKIKATKDYIKSQFKKPITIEQIGSKQLFLVDRLVVFSYREPIGVAENGILYTTKEFFSITSTKHKDIAIKMFKDWHIGYVEIEPKEFKDKYTNIRRRLYGI